jgi:hypothetical protein
MKTPDVKAFFDKVQKLYTMKDMGNPRPLMFFALNHPRLVLAFAERNLSCSS